MTTVLLRKWYKMTQQELSDFFGIPVSTIKNWDSRDCMPLYIHGMMEDLLNLRYRCKNFESSSKKSAFSMQSRSDWNSIAYEALNICKVYPWEDENIQEIEKEEGEL